MKASMVASSFLTGDLFISQLVIPESFNIPENLPHEVKQLFEEMKTLHVSDYDDNDVWERLNAILNNQSYVAESGYRAQHSNIREGDLLHYGTHAYVVLERIRSVDPDEPDQVVISMPILANPVRVGVKLAKQGAALVTGGIVPTKNVHVPVNTVYEIDGAFYIRELPFDGYNTAAFGK